VSFRFIIVDYDLRHETKIWMCVECWCLPISQDAKSQYKYFPICFLCVDVWQTS